ncbi:uncharacterized protein [Cicer arietinum]|uniref:Tetratricopeptide repeat protein 5-like isoform X2 n=1 Tax=Cicer arietinum TaxID=3827 RepID=A0A1S2Y1F6_CICAR|nr:tetratricopeptide repeat protein 5-like isoform X2 [Cicer arietinum]
MKNSVEEEEGDAFVRAAKATESLYHLRDTYYPPNPCDRISTLQHNSDLILNLLDSIPIEQRKLPAQRAIFEYLRGKVFDVFPDYKKEAEDHLSKAVKLNPSLADAWLCLGNCIWKKGDLLAAKNCLNLALNKGPNKKILCKLSMLKRKMSNDNEAELVEESIQHARDAIALDVKDGDSWYNLGNGYLMNFFVTGASDHTKLSQSLKAYQIAEKDEGMKSNPDFYFNSAIANKYQENYQRALSGFEAAALRDPGLNAAEEVQNIVNLLDKVDNLLKVHGRDSRIATLASSSVAVNLISPYRTVTVDFLSEGLNKALAVEGRVLFFIGSDNITPLYYLLCDSNGTCFVLSVYHVRPDVIKGGDQLTLLDPCFRNVDLSWKEKRYQFKSIRLNFYAQVLVNGKTLTRQQAVFTSVDAQHEP